MGIRILCVSVVHVIRSHQFNACLSTHPKQLLIHQFLLWYPMILQFKKIITFSKYLLMLQCCFLRFFIHAPCQIFLHFSSQASAQSNDSLMVLFQNRAIHTRLIIIPFRIALGHDLHQIAVAFVILCQKNQMVIPVIPAGLLPVKT